MALSHPPCPAMIAMDIGESLVGSYMRQVRDCYSVTFNTYLPTSQGEIDVIGVRLSEDGTRPKVYLAEVATHLDVLNYNGYAATVTKVQTKMASARAYAAAIYPNAVVTVELWSPVVPSGLVSQLEDCGGELVVNPALHRLRAGAAQSGRYEHEALGRRCVPHAPASDAPSRAKDVRLR
jgi:hypothetical protein